VTRLVHGAPSDQNAAGTARDALGETMITSPHGIGRIVAVAAATCALTFAAACASATPSRPAAAVSAIPRHPVAARPSRTAGTLGEAACATDRWGTGAKMAGNAISRAPLYLVRVGKHRCYDRVVFDINGPAPVSYVARYVPHVLSDAAGKPVPVAGAAVLQVVVRAPIWGTDDQGHQPGRKPPAVGADLVSPARVAGWSSLAQAKFAGSFEGQTTIALGVRAQLPFRVLVTGDAAYRHVIVDVAHP